MKALERSIPAGEFKAKCLALLDRVARTGEALIVTKRGKAVARVVPPEPPITKSLRGTATYFGDIVHASSGEWESSR